MAYHFKKMLAPTSIESTRRFWMELRSGQANLVTLSLFYTAYVVAGGLSQGLVLIPGVTITFWPPAGLMLATLTLNHRKSWPWWILTGGLAELTCNVFWFHNAVHWALVYYVANALEAVTGAWLLQRFGPAPFRLDSLRDVAIFLLLPVLQAPIVGATIIATTDALIGKHDFLTAWAFVWLGDATGLLVSTPLAVAVILAWRERHSIGLAHYAEALVLGAALIGATSLAFLGIMPTLYLALPPLLWIAARFQLRGAAVGLGLLAVIVAVFSSQGQGPTGVAEEIGQRVVTLQTFLGLSSLSALIVAAISAEYGQAQRLLRAANANLEERIAERTARLAENERRLATILDALPLGVALIDQKGRPEVANAVFAEYVTDVVPSKDDARYALWEGYRGDGRRIARESYPIARALRGEKVWPGEEFLFHGHEGRPIWTRVAALPLSNEKGEVTGATAVISEIDREKRNLDALRESERRLKLALRASAMGVWDWNLRSNRVTWSEETHRVFGVDSFAGTRDDFVSFVHKDDRERLFQAVDDALVSGQLEIEYRIIRGNGQERWVSNQAIVLNDVANQPERILGTVHDITERKRAEEREHLLVGEVNHRSKNMLTLVQAMARQTAVSDPKDFVERFSQRVQALAASQDLLVKRQWREIGLTDLIRSQLAHFADVISDRIELSGAEIGLKAAAAQTLGMAIHELVTNAVKYGAFSNRDGKVKVGWTLSEADAGDVRFVMTWREQGGPEVEEPSRRGFGSTIVERMTQIGLAAEVDLNFMRTGLIWRLECPASHITDAANSALISKFSTVATSSPTP